MDDKYEEQEEDYPHFCMICDCEIKTESEKEEGVCDHCGGTGV